MSNKISKIIAVIVSLSGITVMLGWIFNIQALKSILPQFVTMKFTTAICFVLCGLALYLAVSLRENYAEWKFIALVFICFIIILIMASFITSIFFGIKTGLENLFVSEAPGAIKTIVPGRPALSTMINFVLIAIIGFLSFFNKKHALTIMNFLGLTVSAVGTVASVGYITNISALYGDINDISTAMALHTALLFMILGIGFFIIRDKKFKGKLQS